MGTENGVTIRVRCQKCGITLTATIPRSGEVMLWPGAMYHIKCGHAVKVLSPVFKKMLNGEGLEL